MLAALIVSGCADNQMEPDRSVSLQAKQSTEVLPADVTFAGRVDVQSLRQNSQLDPFGEEKKPWNQIQNGSTARFQDLLNATGLDPKKDIREFYVAKEKGTDGPVSMVLYLNYDRDRLEAYLDEQVAGEMERVQNRDVPFYHQTNGDAALALANEDMIVAGSDSRAVTAMLDRMAGQGRSMSTDASTMDLVRRLSSQHDTWFVAPNLEEHVAETNPHSSDKMERIGQAVRRAGGGVSVQSDGLEGTLWLIPREGVAGSDLAKLVEGAKSAVRAREEQAAAWLDDVTVEARDDGVRITGRLPNEMLSQDNEK